MFSRSNGCRWMHSNLRALMAEKLLPRNVFTRTVTGLRCPASSRPGWCSPSPRGGPGPRREPGPRGSPTRCGGHRDRQVCRTRPGRPGLSHIQSPQAGSMMSRPPRWGGRSPMWSRPPRRACRPSVTDACYRGADGLAGYLSGSWAGLRGGAWRPVFHIRRRGRCRHPRASPAFAVGVRRERRACALAESSGFRPRRPPCRWSSGLGGEAHRYQATGRALAVLPGPAAVFA